MGTEVLQHRRSRRRVTAVVLAAAALFGLVGGMPGAHGQEVICPPSGCGHEAPPPSVSQDVLACYRNDGGEKLVRILGTNEACGSHEHFVQLSPGEQGPTGPPGPSGLSGIHVVSVQTPLATKATVSGATTALCSANEVVTGGGAEITDNVGRVDPESFRGIALVQSRPRDNNTWVATAVADAGVRETGWRLRVYAICAPKA